MEENIYSGPVPDGLRDWLEQWDLDPLPPKALVKFQVIARGPNPKHNYRWILYEDGRWFLARHSGDTSNPEIVFDTELPEEPTRQIPADVVSKVKEQLQQANFLAQPPYHFDKGVRDGAFYIITARIDGKVHKVIYEAAYPPLVEFLDEIVYTYE